MKAYKCNFVDGTGQPTRTADTMTNSHTVYTFSNNPLRGVTSALSSHLVRRVDAAPLLHQQLHHLEQPSRGGTHDAGPAVLYAERRQGALDARARTRRVWGSSKRLERPTKDGATYHLIECMIPWPNFHTPLLKYEDTTALCFEQSGVCPHAACTLRHLGCGVCRDEGR